MYANSSTAFPASNRGRNGPLFPLDNQRPSSGVAASKYSSPYATIKNSPAGLQLSSPFPEGGFGSAYAKPTQQQSPQLDSHNGFSSALLGDDRNTRPSQTTLNMNAHSFKGGRTSAAGGQQQIHIQSDSHYRGNNDNRKESMFQNISAYMNITEENDLPQFVLFLLREEDDNIANFRERVERDKVKFVQQLDHLRRQMSNLIDDLQTHVHQQIDQHFLSFIDRYRSFKQELISYKSVSQELIQAQLRFMEQPEQKMRHIVQPKQFLGKNNSSLIRELDDMQQRNEAAKLQSYIHQCQSTKIRGLHELSANIMASLSSPQPFFNFPNSEDTLESIKNNFAKNLSTAFSDLNQFVKQVDEPATISRSPSQQLQQQQEGAVASQTGSGGGHMNYSNYM